MTRWRLVKPFLPYVTIVADTTDEHVAKEVEAAAERAGVELLRIEQGPRPPGGRKQFVAMAGWKRTTSPEYDKLPHEYTMRGRACAGKTEAPPVEWHDWFRAQIREHGYKRPYTNPETGRTYTYTYMDFDGYRYWTFQLIINRVPSEDTAGLGEPVE